MSGLNVLLAADGAAFSLAGLVMMVSPSPQPILARPVDDASLTPIVETRRLLASMVLASGLLLLVFGFAVRDPSALTMAGRARALSLAVVMAVNTAQLRAGHWRRASLLVLLSVFAGLITGYVALLV